MMARPAGMSSDDDYSDSDEYDYYRPHRVKYAHVPVVISDETRLKNAIFSGDLNEVRAILDSSANPSKMALENVPYVADLGKVVVLREMLKYVKEINEPLSYTGLMAAASSLKDRDETLECAKVLLEAGADPNIIFRDGITALMNAAQYDRLDIVRELVKYGADLELRDIDGWSALFYAVNKDHADVVEFLKSVNACDDFRDKKGRFPYDLAKSKNYEGMCSILNQPPLSIMERFYVNTSEFTTPPNDPLDEIKSGFQTHAFQFLADMGMGIYLKKFKEAKITLFELLNISDERLREIGIPFKSRRMEILKNIKLFHLHRWGSTSIDMPKELRFEKTIISFANSTRQIYIMRATLEYAKNHLDVDFGDLESKAQLVKTLERIGEKMAHLRETFCSIDERNKEIDAKSNLSRYSQKLDYKRKNLVSTENFALLLTGAACVLFFYNYPVNRFRI